MREESLDFPPVDNKAVHQGIDELAGIAVGIVGQVRITGGSQNAVMTENFLDFKQIDAGFNQMGGIAVP